jgi:hypothetical protein
MAGGPGIRRVNIRHDPTMGESGTYLLRCDDCAVAGQSGAYWPLTDEFWAPNQGLQRCRACHNARKRKRHKQTDEERRARARQWYREDRERRLQYAADYLAANRERINTERRRRNAEHRDERNAARRERAAARRAA